MQTHTNIQPSALDRKTQDKKQIQSEFDWPHEPRCPLLCIPTEITEMSGGTLLLDVLPGLLTLPIAILIRGCGHATFGNRISEYQKAHAHRMGIMPNTDKTLETMIRASDMALFCTDPTNLPEFIQTLGSGTIPIMPATPRVDEYNPIQENGIAFCFTEASPWHCFASVVRAIETYRFPFDWKHIQKACMQSIR